MEDEEIQSLITILDNDQDSITSLLKSNATRKYTLMTIANTGKRLGNAKDMTCIMTSAIDIVRYDMDENIDALVDIMACMCILIEENHVNSDNFKHVYTLEKAYI